MANNYKKACNRRKKTVSTEKKRLGGWEFWMVLYFCNIYLLLQIDHKFNYAKTIVKDMLGEHVKRVEDYDRQ